MLGCLLPISLGLRLPNANLDVRPESRIWVNGTSSVRSFECRATSFDATVESVVPGAAAAVLTGVKAVGAVEIKVPIERLDCGNGTMNGHMRKALKAQDSPVITFSLASYELKKAAESVDVELQGQLSIGGTQKPVTIEADAVPAEGGAIRVSGTYELRMTEFALKPPSLMFGTMKVGDVVKVRFDVLLNERGE
jgi:hypothetical protein